MSDEYLLRKYLEKALKVVLVKPWEAASLADADAVLKMLRDDGYDVVKVK